MKRLRSALPLLLLVLIGVALYFSGALHALTPQQLLLHQDDLRAGIAAHPWLSRLTLIGLMVMATATGLPGLLLVVIMAGGFAFGTVEATLCCSVGLTLGSLLLYLASGYAFRGSERPPPAIVAKLRQGFERHPVSYTFFLRFVPVVPFGAVTVGLAWLRCPPRLFVAATWLGGTVSLIFETSIGAGLSDVMRETGSVGPEMLLHKQILLPMAAIAALALLPLLLERLSRKRRSSPH